MQFSYFLAFCFIVGVQCATVVDVNVGDKERHVEERHGLRKEEHLGRERDERKSSERFDDERRDLFRLLHEKKEDLFVERQIEFFLKNPNTQFERECFAKFDSDDSVDFVIDIAPSPSMDKVDTLMAESPVAYYLEDKYRSPSRNYFSYIEMFINAVTFEMKPDLTHSVIYDNGRKYFLKGRECKVESDEIHGKKGGEFNDLARNLKTLWPVATKSLPEHYGHYGQFRSFLKNNLGRMTKLVLWNRDNGLPTVLSGSRRSKPIYTVVITDGASGAKIQDLTDDLERTTVIDIGNQRFIKNLSWDDMNTLVSVINLPAPAALGSLIGTTRAMARRLCR